MSAPLHQEVTLVTAAGLAAGATGDKATLAMPFNKQEAILAWVEWEGSSTNATGAIIKFDKRPTAGSDTGRGDGDVAVIKKVASVNKQGKRTYKKLSPAVSLEAGQEVVVEVTTANGDALPFKAGLVVVPVPEVPENVAAMEATT